MNKTKLLAAILLAIFTFTMAPLSVGASNDGKIKVHDKNSHYIQQCSDLPDLKSDKEIAQEVYWDEEESIRLLEVDIANAKEDVKNSSGAEKQKFKEDLKEYKRLLKVAKKSFWDAEGELKWLNNEIKKLDKFCYGQKPEHGNHYSWGKNFGNWVSGWWAKAHAKGGKDD